MITKNLRRLDPSRTTLIRKAFFHEVRLRFAKLKLAIMELIITDDAFGLKDGSNPLLNAWTDEAREKSIEARRAHAVSKPGKVKVSKETEDWVDKWTVGSGDEFAPPPKISDKSLNELAPTVPKNPIKVYRAASSTADDFHPDMQSWTSDRDVAEGIADTLGQAGAGRRVVLEKYAQRGEIVAVVGKIKGHERIGIESEVILARSDKMLERIAKLRGEAKPSTILKPQDTGYEPLTENQVRNVSKDFKFLSVDKKIEAFMSWLDTKIKEILLPPVKWEGKYIERTYKESIARVFKKVKGRGVSDEFFRGMENEFMRSMGQRPTVRTMLAFNAKRVNTPRALAMRARQQPKDAEGRFIKMRMLTTKTRQEMEGMTARMKQKITRILTEEFSRRTSAKEIAKRIAKTLDVSKRDAARIVNSEIVSTAAESQLDAMESLGIELVEVLAEFVTSGDGLVCPECSEMEGEQFTIEEARGVIPVHPNCRCSWTYVFES